MADNSYKNILDNLKEIVNRRLTSGSGAISSTNLVLDFQKNLYLKIQLHHPLQ